MKSIAKHPWTLTPLSLAVVASFFAVRGEAGEQWVSPRELAHARNRYAHLRKGLETKLTLPLIPSNSPGEFVLGEGPIEAVKDDPIPEDW